MNVANPDESDDYDMDDDANNNIDDARGHSSAVSGVDSSSSRSSSSASTVNSSALRQISDTMAGRSSGRSIIKAPLHQSPFPGQQLTRVSIQSLLQDSAQKNDALMLIKQSS